MTKEKTKPKTGLQLLREPFPANLIGKLPKPTAAQTAEVKKDFKKGIRCDICGQWHHPKVVHLDYVGHAALTDRLLDCDPEWNWEPFSVDDNGQPVIINDGLWIRLTVCGVTRAGYGDAQGKTGGNAIKEMIGDALRNAAMRFGAALDLWHKGELHGDEETPEPVKTEPAKTKSSKPSVEENVQKNNAKNWIEIWKADAKKGADRKVWWNEKKDGIIADCGIDIAKTVHAEVSK